jgi:aryl-alcohol dehydrogenase-like predicted oxidoreductase
MNKMNNSRRNFIKKSAVGLAGVSILSSPFPLPGEDKPGVQETGKKGKIITRVLGKTGLKLPVVSMGVMNADNPNLVSAALDAGIVMLDTAHAYQRGKNEEMIGQVIKDRPRDSFVIATKVAGDYLDRKTGLFTENTKAEAFMEKFSTSLKRLGLDHVDILYLHSVVKRGAVLFEPLLNAMVKLKKEGKTRFIGVSTHRNEPEVLRAAADSKVHDVVLTAYNFRQPHIKEMHQAIAYAAKAGLGIIAMKTQAGVYWDRERQKQINMKAALKWALQNENVHTAIPGFTAFDQMKLDISVMEDLTLTAREKADLDLGQELGMAGLYCQHCGKCLAQCRNNVDIPTFMRGYMYAYGYKNLSLAAETLQAQLAEDSHLVCKNCSGCTVKCTMGFDVRGKILDVARIKEIPGDFLA